VIPHPLQPEEIRIATKPSKNQTSTKLKPWSKLEALAWTPPEDITVSGWADSHRVLHALTSAEAGQWSTDRTPYLRGIMNAFSDPVVEQITIASSTQVGKTETILNAIAYSIDQDPGPALMVMPREDDCVSMSTRRVRPMIESCERLKRHLSEKKSDNRQKEIRFVGSMLYFAGANSPADLASRPIRYLFADEVDKYPAFSGREADPVALAIERTRTFWNRKIVLTSTPTTRDGYIWREFEKSDQCLYYVPCPRCHEFQALEFRAIHWPEDERDPARIRDHRLAVYRCIECGSEIADNEKPRMLRAGGWVPEGTKIGRDGTVRGIEPVSHRGFRINCLYSPWINWSDVAAKFLEAKDNVPLLLNFVNSWLGYVWEEQAEKIDPEALAARADSYERGTVPDGAVVLVAGVDVQADSFYYVIRAFGYGERSWLIEAGQIETWEGLIRHVFQGDFPGASGGQHRVRLTCIDSGYRTDEVYRVCREWLELARPVKGQQRMASVPIRAVKIDRDFGGAPIRGSVRLWHVDTSHFKDKLVRLQGTPDDQPGAWRLHRDPGEDYLRQVTAEHKILKRNKQTGLTKSEWVPKPGGGPNHWLDCEVYATAAADMLAVYTLKDGTQGDEQQPRRPADGASIIRDDQHRQRAGGWVTGGGDGQRRGWIK